MANSSSRCVPSRNTQYVFEKFATRQSPNHRSAQVTAASITLVKRRRRVVASEPDYDSVHSRMPFHQSCTVVSALSLFWTPDHSNSTRPLESRHLVRRRGCAIPVDNILEFGIIAGVDFLDVEVESMDPDDIDGSEIHPGFVLRHSRVPVHRAEDPLG